MSDQPLVESQPRYILTGQDYLNLPRESTPWVVRGIVPQGGAVLIYGAAKTGKSFAAIQLALAIKAGGDWFGFKVERPSDVVYVQLDTPRPIWQERLEELRRSGIGIIDQLLYADRESLGTFPFDIRRDEHMGLLKGALGQLNPAVVIIDTIREAHTGDENDSTDMQSVIARLANATQPAAMILVSHSRKPQADVHADIMADNRGSNYVVGRMDTIIRFTRKQMFYSGRSIEEGSYKLVRTANHLWDIAPEPIKEEVDNPS